MSIKQKVVVAMSGGVDSSVAAALLKEQGHEVIGVTMQIWRKRDERQETCLPAGKAGDEKSCCSVSAVEDARRVADKLGIPYYVLNFRDIFKKAVIDDFIREYNNGHTPNPCVRCNRFVKFDALLKKVRGLGADFIATGHYARVERNNGSYLLKKGIDKKKDQSYFLYPVSQEALSRTIFPVGGLTKAEVRGLARKFGLKVADKKESQEICFVEGSIGDFFKPQKGDIIDMKGKVVGTHKGYQLYTVGQRRGLGLSRPNPAYVVKIDAKSNKITIGDKGDVYGDDLTVGQMSYIYVNRLTSPMGAKVKIRYNSPETDAEIMPLSQGKVRVMFKEPQFAITPGQSAVFYDGDNVIGGGIIGA